MENIFSEEDLYLYVQNGGNLNYVRQYINIKDIPQEYINKRAENGFSLNSSLSEKQISSIPQDSINKFAKRSKQWFYLSEDQIKNIPQNIVNEYVANGGDIFSLPENKYSDIPQEYINKRAENGYDMENYIIYRQGLIEKVPQSIINQRAEKGYSLKGFSQDQIENIPQDIINIYASKGKYLNVFMRDKIEKILPEFMYEYVANGGDLGIFAEEELDLIPQEYINKRAENGWNMEDFSIEQIENIPQNIVNKCLEDCACAINQNGFTDDQLLNAEVVNLNKAYANGNSLEYYDYGDNFSETNKKIASKISDKILEPTEKGKQALILYTIGKMKAKDLPVDVYVNYELRNNFLNVLKVNTINKFNQMCKEKGYDNSVPPQVQKAFDEKLQSFYAEVERRKEEGVKELSEIIEKKFADLNNSQKEQNKQNCINDINSWEM